MTPSQVPLGSLSHFLGLLDWGSENLGSCLISLKSINLSDLFSYKVRGMIGGSLKPSQLQIAKTLFKPIWKRDSEGYFLDRMMTAFLYANVHCEFQKGGWNMNCWWKRVDPGGLTTPASKIGKDLRCLCERNDQWSWETENLGETHLESIDWECGRNQLFDFSKCYFLIMS